MREILFRGKREDGEGWVYGHYHDTTYVGYPNGGDNKITRHYILPQNAGDAHVVIPKTVGQYTGLTDKNGKKIFEGDLIRHYNRSNQPGVYDLYRIEFDVRVCMWVGRYNDNYAAQLRDYLGEHYEVVGNIHDNPELLEETDNA